MPNTPIDPEIRKGAAEKASFFGLLTGIVIARRLKMRRKRIDPDEREIQSSARSGGYLLS